MVFTTGLPKHKIIYSIDTVSNDVSIIPVVHHDVEVAKTPFPSCHQPHETPREAAMMLQGPCDKSLEHLVPHGACAPFPVPDNGRELRVPIVM
jgi:hypothetical protein